MAWQPKGNIKGPKGDAGAQGATGAQGMPGVAGEQWFAGAGVPSSGVGAINDWYLNNSNGDFYEKTSGTTWTLRGNLKGPQGNTGSQGSQGATGSQGRKASKDRKACKVLRVQLDKPKHGGVVVAHHLAALVRLVTSTSTMLTATYPKRQVAAHGLRALTSWGLKVQQVQPQLRAYCFLPRLETLHN